MAYTTVNDEHARRAPELTDRIGETIESKKLAKILGQYEEPERDLRAPRLTPKPRKAAAKKTTKRTRKTSTRKAK